MWAAAGLPFGWHLELPRAGHGLELTDICQVCACCRDLYSAGFEMPWGLGDSGLTANIMVT